MTDDQQNKSNFRDSISTIDNKGKRVFVHPKKPKGRFYNRRLIVGWTLISFLFLIPFIKLNGYPL